MSYYKFIVEYEHPTEWGIGVVGGAGPFADGRSPQPKMIAAVLREIADQMDAWPEDMGTAAIEYPGNIGDERYLAMCDALGSFRESLGSPDPEEP